MQTDFITSSNASELKRTNTPHFLGTGKSFGDFLISDSLLHMFPFISYETLKGYSIRWVCKYTLVYSRNSLPPTLSSFYILVPRTMWNHETVCVEHIQNSSFPDPLTDISLSFLSAWIIGLRNKCYINFGRRTKEDHRDKRIVVDRIFMCWRQKVEVQISTEIWPG